MVQRRCPCCVETGRPPYIEAQHLFIEDQLNAIDDELAKKFIPLGHNRSIKDLPIDIEITEDFIDQAIDFFEQLTGEDFDPNLTGILLSIPIGDKPTEDEPLYRELDDDWEWHYDTHTYYNNKTEVEINEEDKDTMANQIMDLYILSLLSPTTKLVTKKMTIQRWVRIISDEIQKGNLMHPMLALGGKNTVDGFDTLVMAQNVVKHFTYLSKFAQEIASGKLSIAQILNRIAMYGEAVTHGYEQAKAKSHGIELPEYPADGNQDCYTKCRCSWKITTDPSDPTYKLCTWELNPLAEHCNACVENSRRWVKERVKVGTKLPS